MGLEDLAVVVLQQVGAVAVQHAGPPAGQRGGMAAGLDAVAAGLDADHRDGGIVEERVEQAHGVGAAADAGDQRVGQPAFAPHASARALRSPMTDWKSRTIDGIGMRAGDGADDVEGVVDIGDPVAQRLVHRVLEGARAAT